jgi:gluconolactonase
MHAHFRGLFPPDVSVQLVATGFQFTEGPVWIPQEKALLFSDIPAGVIYKLTQDRHVSTFRKPSGHANGLTLDRQGRLLACEHGTRRVTRTEKSGTVTVLASKFNGKKLNSPNDIIVRKDGTIYFTDPPYGIEEREQEQPVQGVYRLTPDGRTLSVVAEDFSRPNGLAFSPDEKRLYIDDSSALRVVRVFDVRADGTLSGGAIFHDMSRAGPGTPDGMKVDLEGRLFCTGPGGIWVLNPQGTHLGTILTPEEPSNCAWGDEDNQSLYITAKTSVYKMRVNCPGIATS